MQIIINSIPITVSSCNLFCFFESIGVFFFFFIIYFLAKLVA